MAIRSNDTVEASRKRFFEANLRSRKAKTKHKKRSRLERWRSRLELKPGSCVDEHW